MVPRDGIEPPSVPCKGTALPLDERGIGRGIRTRTLNDRIKICSVANYTIPQQNIQIFKDQ